MLLSGQAPSQPPPGHSLPAREYGMGAGGGGGPPGYPYSGRIEVNEQIAVALVRLQQDMSSVLSRLNTLEALTLAQHQV